MPRRRVYVPISARGLRDLVRDRQLGPAPLLAHAAAADTSSAILEEAEHAAWLAAAAVARVADARRVIGSADVDAALVTPLDEGDPHRMGGPTAVEVEAPIPLRHFVSFHVDEQRGGADTDLLWYDVTEIADVLALLDS